MARHHIFEFLAKQAKAGQHTCLVTVTGVTGATVRNPGAHMAVAANGDYAGSLSGGCIEAAVVAEAQAAMAARVPHAVRFGAGSPYMDIRLPCGGGVDLLFTPLDDDSLANAAIAAFAARMPFTLHLPANAACGVVMAAQNETASRWHGNDFRVFHPPHLRLLAVGHGGVIEALAPLSKALHCEIEVFTPDNGICARLVTASVPCTRLVTPGSVDGLTSDPWTAICFFFHDHDWEARLLERALALPSLFVGAMGSRKTHETRLQQLAALGVSDGDRARIVSPIGLIPSSRDPETLALSTMTQVVETYNKAIGQSG